MPEANCFLFIDKSLKSNIIHLHSLTN